MRALSLSIEGEHCSPFCTYTIKRTPMNELMPHTQVTMSSVDLVEYINNQRAKDDTATLRHRDFIAKVPKVLGFGGSDKYRSMETLSNGQERVIYNFPKREACLMAMSYSYDLQAKVYDYMTALEQHVLTPKVPQTFAEALQLAADQAKQIELISHERDEAIRTKHHISDKKTASALGKLGATTKKFSSFKDEKGCGTRFATVNEVSDRTGKSYKGLALTNWCKENNIHYCTHNMTRNTTVNNYPAIAWLEVYAVDLDDLFDL